MQFIQFLAAIVVVSQSAFAATMPPLPSSIEGVEIPNAHYVNERLIRGGTPTPYLQDLVDLSVTDILIFKKDTKGEVEQEVEALIELGYAEENIHLIPFQWEDFDNIEACEQTMDALSLMVQVQESADRALFYHCTLGEDRTGMLSGLYRIAMAGWSVDDAFQSEMCERGYEAGNPQKPIFVVNYIRRDITPLFLGMVELVQEAQANGTELSRAACQYININEEYDRSRFTCGQ